MVLAVLSSGGKYGTRCVRQWEDDLVLPVFRAMENDLVLAILLPSKGWDYRHEYHAYKSRFELSLSLFCLLKQSTTGGVVCKVNLPQNFGNLGALSWEGLTVGGWKTLNKGRQNAHA